MAQAQVEFINFPLFVCVCVSVFAVVETNVAMHNGFLSLHTNVYLYDCVYVLHKVSRCNVFVHRNDMKGKLYVIHNHDDDDDDENNCTYRF